MSSNINWNVNLKDSGTIVARTKVDFTMVYLVYKNEGIYYWLSPLVEDDGVLLGGDACLLIRQLPKMDFESALREVEKRIHNSACFINFSDCEDDVICWNGWDNVITKTVISDTNKMIFDITYKGDRRVVDVEKTLVLSDSPRIEYKVSVDGGERTTAKVHYYAK